MKPGWRWVVFIRLLGFLRPFYSRVLLSVFLGIGTVAAGIGLLGTSAYLISYAALGPSIAALQVAIVGVRFFGITRAVSRYLERLVSHSANFRLLAGFRVWFYRAIEPLAPAGLQDERGGDLLGRVIADVDTLENFYVRAVSPPVVALVIILGTGLFFSLYDLRLAMLILVALAAHGLGLPLLAYRLTRAPGNAVVEQRSALSANLLETVQGMADLLVYGQAAERASRAAQLSTDVGSAQVRLASAGALTNALGLLVSGLALWGVLLLAIPLVGQGLTGIHLAVLALVTLAVFEAVIPLVPAAQHLESSLQAARRLFALEQADLPILPTAHPIPPPSSMALSIRGLRFAYPESSTPALDGLDLELPPGKHMALVGSSGAGKTTLFKLLLRFWDYEQGQVLLGGRDLREYDPQDVRRRMAYVSQDTYLFSGTLRQNLLLANPQAGEDALQRVVTLAHLSDLVDRLPQGLDTWIGDQGLGLSGGERQRVAVARALLVDAPLLLLDEPTANLDSLHERSVLNALRQASAGRSVLYITHRLVGLETMDEILVLKAGRVVERGAHAALLEKNGLYALMWQIERQLLG
jgi:ATP-binding cassette, subfamily C, bacterial CydC